MSDVINHGFSVRLLKMVIQKNSISVLPCVGVRGIMLYDSVDFERSKFMAVEERHEVVYEGIATMLHCGELAKGQKLPSERQLIERFNVSRPTINKAITRLIAEGVLYKKNGRKGAFISTDNVESLRRRTVTPQQSKLIKYIPPRNTGEHPIQYGVMEGIYSVASTCGFRTVPEYVAGRKDWVEQALGDDIEQLGGLVIYGHSFDFSSSEIESLNACGVPYVIVDSMPEIGEFNFVGTDNVKGAHLMVDHLFSLGHKNICYITEKDLHGSMKQRLAGFLQGMITHDLEVTSDSVVKIDETDEAALADVVAKLLARADRPSAIFASHDKFLAKIYEILNRMGIDCPSDISLAGYDDIDLSACMPVPLTTIRQDFFKMGKLAMELILNENGIAPLPQKILLDPELMVRKSTGPYNPGR